MTRLVLASGSVSRKRLLENAGLAFETVVSGVDEAELKREFEKKGLPAKNWVMMLAEAKAAKVSRDFPDDTIIGADQILVKDGRVYSKAHTRGAAADVLKRLQGGEHELMTACVLMRANTVIWRTQETCALAMRPLSDPSIEEYLDQVGDSVLGSIGCYHLEGRGIQLFNRVEGNYFSILGLPLLPLLWALRQFGVLGE